jgi:hypothetical protein
MAKKKKNALFYAATHSVHYQSSALIFLSLLTAVAHKKLTLPKR